MKRRSRGCLVFVAIGALLLLSPVFWRKVIVKRYGAEVHATSDVPARSTAIVFGAAVFGGDRLSTVLRDRMDAAIALYKQGSVEELLVSGDGLSAAYNEPAAMKAYAVRMGVDEKDIRTDFGGRRTYDTCYRALNLFDVRDAILVTQEFHLYRALFVCDRLGMEAVGVAADQRAYRGARWYELRETAATLVALSDVLRQREPAITTLMPITQQGIR